MNSSTRLWVLLALVLGVLALFLTPEYSAAFPPASNPTPTRTPAPRKASDTEFTLYLPIIFKAPGPIYLPVVMRAASPTPTRTPTRTPTPIPNPIRNWNFESGNTAWYENPPNEIITNNLMGKPAYSGRWAAWLGGDFPPPGQDLVHTLAQQVTIPVGATTLSFWYWIDSVEFCGYYDEAFVYVGTAMLARFDLCSPNNTNGWVRHTINISAYAGQTLWIQFIARVDQDTNSNFLLDDVVIN